MIQIFRLFNGVFIFSYLVLVPFGALHAYETDQYTVAPNKIADSGRGFSQFVFQQLDQALSEVNLNLEKLPEQIDQLKSERNLIFRQFPQTEMMNLPEDGKSALQYIDQQLMTLTKLYQELQTELGIVQFIQSKVSWKVTWQDQRDGVFRLPINLWPLGEPEESFKYHAGRLETVYSFSGFHRIISPSVFVFASTYNMYGVHLGWDKIGHILNQGFQYFESFRHEISKSGSVESSYQKAITLGVESEDGFFGQIVDGVYSNADLAANFAGFLFFQNFFHVVRIGEKQLPPLFFRNDEGKLVWNSQHGRSADLFMKDFITDHLNESLNPTVIDLPQRGIVRRAIENRCMNWKQYYGIHSYQEIVQRVQKLKNWFGYEYGNRSENTLRIEEICFDAKN